MNREAPASLLDRQLHEDHVEVLGSNDWILLVRARLGKERICEFHAKDFKGLYGQGNIEFAKMRDAMRNIGWNDAWVHIEGTQLPNGVEQDVRFDAEFLRDTFRVATA